MEKDNPCEIKNNSILEIITEFKKLNNSFSTIDAKHFQKLLVQYGFLDEKGCPICEVVNFENTVLLRPTVKDQLTYLKNIFLISELTLCPQHITRRVIGRYNLTQTVNVLQNQSTGYVTPAFSPGDQNSEFDTTQVAPRVERLIPNIENTESRFRSQNQHQSPSFVPYNSTCGLTNYLPNALNSSSRMAETESSLFSEDVLPYYTFGATAVSSSPAKQNNFPRPTINSTPLSPLPPSPPNIWNHIENNVMSPLVTDNFCFAVPNTEEAYMRFRETSKSAVDDEAAWTRRMAYTKNFQLQPAENPAPSTISSTSIVSSRPTNSDGALAETYRGRRGKKILGQGIYKK